ncbi:MAG: helix-turn-helix transcriptional regulator [Ruminococcaceae bacterium]|nr:helix-turn-helix transcriptional regulator [Oscillospiraceae bacterium]
MAVSYNKLWKMLIDKKMKRVELQRAADFSSNVLARLNKDEYVSMESMEKICCALDCNIGDVMDFVENN